MLVFSQMFLFMGGGSFCCLFVSMNVVCVCICVCEYTRIVFSSVGIGSCIPSPHLLFFFSFYNFSPEGY
eukprot:m.1203 g.1203  ORF g.1203 m.1203 type:complete len:69 (-) comp1070_c0_seq1:14-220(-)